MARMFGTNYPARKRVTGFLKRNAGVPYCDDCIRKALNIARIHLNELGMAENAGAAGLLRNWDIRATCGERRVTTKAKAGMH